MSLIKKYRRSHAADWISSNQLQAAWKLLKQRGRTGATTLDLHNISGSLSPSTVVSNLRANGIKISPAKYIYSSANGNKIYLYKLEESCSPTW